MKQNDIIIASLQAMLENNIGQHRQLMKQFALHGASPTSEFFIFLQHQHQRQQADEIKSLIDDLTLNGVNVTEARKCLKEWFRYG